MANQYRYLFGPVPSRRLGRSLGVDLTPFKTCSFDCIFCQLGRTTDKTLERREYVPVDEVVTELDRWLKAGGTADYITLAGSGEPTLNSGFGRVVEFVRKATTIPVAVLTNGSLLADPEVVAGAARANVVKVSLSAWDQYSLDYINRPHPDIEFDRLLTGQRFFRRQFRGELWLEVFLAWGVNSTEKDVSRIAELAKTIRADKIHLNTAVRPPCEGSVRAVPEGRMAGLAELFDPPAEVVAEYSSNVSAAFKANELDIHDLLKRRPCTLEQICLVFGLHRNEATKYLGRLTRTNRVRRERRDGGLYFVGLQGKDAGA